jgi:hypothetical protein
MTSEICSILKFIISFVITSSILLLLLGVINRYIINEKTNLKDILLLRNIQNATPLSYVMTVIAVINYLVIAYILLVELFFYLYSLIKIC